LFSPTGVQLTIGGGGAQLRTIEGVMKKRHALKRRKATPRDVVHLEDLAPRNPVVGGAGKLLFGERLDPRTDEGSAAGTEKANPRD
jgi:hypothetical protein